MSGVVTGSRLERLYALRGQIEHAIVQERQRLALDDRDSAHRPKLPPPRSLAWRLMVPRQAVGATDREIKAWAMEVGLLDGIHRGTVSLDLVHAYAAAHPQAVVST